MYFSVCLSIYMYVSHVCVVPTKARIAPYGAGVTHHFELPCGYWKLHPVLRKSSKCSS